MDIRNIAIIAHVDHGKTTLVDKLLAPVGRLPRAPAGGRARDGPQRPGARARHHHPGQVHLACVWKDTRINIVDTPGHADFGGEVERILNMVDGAIVLVDAAEGVLPQTKFVVGKALARGIRPIVVVNKVDRGDARPDEVHTEVFDLFAALGRRPTSSSISRCCTPPAGRAGRTTHWTARARTSRRCSTWWCATCRAPTVDPDGAVRDGRLHPGIRQLPRPRADRPRRAGPRPLNMPVKVLRIDGSMVETGRLTKLLSFRGLDRVPVEEAQAGDIIAVAGLSDATIPDTIGAPDLAAPLPAIPVDPPTLAMTFRINDGPLGGREGKKVTSPPDPRPAVPRGRGQRRHQGDRQQRDSRRSRSPAAANCSSAC